MDTKSIDKKSQYANNPSTLGWIWNKTVEAFSSFRVTTDNTQTHSTDHFQDLEMCMQEIYAREMEQRTLPEGIELQDVVVQGFEEPTQNPALSRLTNAIETSSNPENPETLIQPEHSLKNYDLLTLSINKGLILKTLRSKNEINQQLEEQLIAMIKDFKKNEWGHILMKKLDEEIWDLRLKEGRYAEPQLKRIHTHCGVW